MKKIKKISFWFNPTQVSQRWDGEIWYTDGTQERLTNVTPEQAIQKIQEGMK